MNEYLHREINDLLDHISLGQETRRDNPHNGVQPRKRLNVYIEVEEEDVPLEAIESRVDEQATLTTDDDRHVPLFTEESLRSPVTAPQFTRRWRRTHLALLLLLGMSLFGISVGILSVGIRSFLTPSATITIVSASQRVTTTSILQVTTNGTSDPTKNQVRGRVLLSITMSQARTVSTTGTTYQDAKTAHGFITFYNAASYVQTVNTGTMIAGADGIQVITDQDAIIPAAIMPIEGQVTIKGHAATTGPQGNIRAGNLYGACCRLNVFVTNGAFHGGQDARTYQTTTQQDINSVVNILKTSLEQSIEAALQTQVQPSETLITPLSCTSNVTSDHQPGEESTQVHVTTNETCIGTTYDTQAGTTLLTTLATKDATKRLGIGYMTTGIHITQATLSNQSSRELRVKSISLWAYPFTQEQQSSIKAMIVGTSKDKATAVLLRMTGVQSVAIILKNSRTLPSDRQQIHLLFLQV